MKKIFLCFFTLLFFVVFYLTDVYAYVVIPETVPESTIGSFYVSDLNTNTQIVETKKVGTETQIGYTKKRLVKVPVLVSIPLHTYSSVYCDEGESYEFTVTNITSQETTEELRIANTISCSTELRSNFTTTFPIANLEIAKSDSFEHSLFVEHAILNTNTNTTSISTTISGSNNASSYIYLQTRVDGYFYFEYTYYYYKNSINSCKVESITAFFDATSEEYYIATKYDYINGELTCIENSIFVTYLY